VATDRWGVPIGSGRNGFHDLRHYYASLIVRHGESIKTVQHRLAHAIAVETLDTRSHLFGKRLTRPLVMCPQRAPKWVLGEVLPGHRLGEDDVAYKPQTDQKSIM
jgi:hypothetical protein